MIYLEEITIKNCLKFLVKFKLTNKKKNIYFIYNKPLDKILIFFFNFFFRVNFIKLDFKMSNIKNKNGELLREYIPRETLFKIFENFKNYNFNKVNDEFLLFYLSKLIIGEGIHIKKSLFRFIYLINVINDKNSKLNINKSYYIIKDRPWLEICRNYALENNIHLETTTNNFILISRNFNILIKQLKIFFFKIFKSNSFYNNNMNIKLYCEGKGNFNFKLDGIKTDFAWLMLSDYPYNKTVYNSNYNNLSKHNQIITTFNFFRKKYNYLRYKFKINYGLYNQKDRLDLKKAIHDYHYWLNLWYSYFRTHNIRLTLNWYKYDSRHLPMHDALNRLNGISIFQQINFEGHRNFSCKLYSDICFYFSEYSAKNDINNGSIVNNKIVVGLPVYPVSEKMKTNAKLLRNRLLKNGVEKIVCVLDENSLDDDRFHTGHDFQRNNYNFILLELFKNQKLGVIFKPKSPATLRKRLGKVNNLLNQAINTGRCYVYEEYEKGIPYSKSSPLLAALSSDLVIHGHLSAGTAALETASNNIPTILIDPEKDLENIFYKKLNNNIIYENWENAIQATNQLLFSQKVPNYKIGDWTNIIKFFDPFLDNNSNTRIGNFLNDLNVNLSKNLSKTESIKIAIENYKIKWGIDKVIL